MPFYDRGNVRIRYEECGSGFPLLVTPGGGLNSRVSNWPTAVFNAPEAFKNEFRCITMDQRNANGGESTGPVPVDDPWDAFADDQLGLMDHLGIREFFYMGYCIGGCFAGKLMQRKSFLNTSIAFITAVGQLLTREFSPPPGVTKSGKPDPSPHSGYEHRLSGRTAWKFLLGLVGKSPRRRSHTAGRRTMADPWVDQFGARVQPKLRRHVARTQPHYRTSAPRSRQALKVD